MRGDGSLKLMSLIRVTENVEKDEAMLWCRYGFEIMSHEDEPIEMQ